MARKLMYGLLAFVLVAVGLVTAAAADPNGWPGAAGGGRRSAIGRGGGQTALVDHPDDSAFAQLVNSASPDALHRLLHEYFPGTFKDGVYASDKSAVEAIRSEDAGLATSLVHLAKRQNDSTAGPASISSTLLPSSSSTPQSSEPPTSQPPAPPSSTPSEPPSPPSSTSENPPPPSSTPSPSPSGPAPSSTPGSSPGATPSTGPPSSSPGPSPGPTGSPSSGGNGNPTSSNPVSVSSLIPTSTPLSSPLLTSMGTTLTTSTSPDGTSSASRRTVTYTSTLPGGRVTTVTSVEIVTGAADNPSPTGNGQGRLQTGAAVPRFAGSQFEVVLGAVIGGVLLA